MWPVQSDTKVCTHVVSVSADSSVVFKLMLTRGHSDAVLCLQFVGDTLVSGASDQTIKVIIGLSNNEVSNSLFCSGMESATRSV